MAGEHAQLSLRRSGGLAGLPMQAQLDTSELPDQEAKELLEALDRVDLGTAGRAPGAPPGAADGFHYELGVSRGGRTETTSFSERQVPTALAPLIARLMERAEPAPRR